VTPIRSALNKSWTASGEFAASVPIHVGRASARGIGRVESHQAGVAKRKRMEEATSR
jgi:hypothetical protein